MSLLQSLLSRSATSSSGTLTCSTQPHGRHDRGLARSAGQRVDSRWQAPCRRRLTCASLIIFGGSLTAARFPLGWLQSQEMYAPTLQSYINCMLVGPYLRGGVPLAHSDAALHRPLQGVSVHSDGKGDAQLICPGVPLANCCACGSLSRTLLHGAWYGSMYGTQGHADCGSQIPELGGAKPVVSTVLARPARRSLVDILRATSSRSLDCTRGNTAAFKGATAGWNLHRMIIDPHTLWQAICCRNRCTRLHAAHPAAAGSACAAMAACTEQPSALPSHAKHRRSSDQKASFLPKYSLLLAALSLIVGMLKHAVQYPANAKRGLDH